MNLYDVEIKNRLKVKRTKKEKELMEVNGYTIIYEQTKKDKDGLFRYEISIFSNGYDFGTFNIASEGGFELLTDIKHLLSLIHKI